MRGTDDDACGTEISLHLGFHTMDIAPSPIRFWLGVFHTVRLCRKCEAGAYHAIAKFVAYQRRSRGAESLWSEET